MWGQGKASICNAERRREVGMKSPQSAAQLWAKLIEKPELPSTEIHGEWARPNRATLWVRTAKGDRAMAQTLATANDCSQFSLKGRSFRKDI